MPLQLASGRKALAKIIVPPDATPQETYASTELRDYLDLITSAVFEITYAPYDGAGIAIGRAAFAYSEADAGLGGRRARLEVELRQGPQDDVLGRFGGRARGMGGHRV